MKTPLAASLALSLAMLGCSGSVPAVEIVGASPETLSASDDAMDDLTITVRYSDPDGDLGQGIARILDCRAEGLVTELGIPRIANDEAVAQGAPIEGEMQLVVADVGDVAASESVPAACADLGVSKPSDGAQVFCVVLVDTAGNESEGACTARVTIGP
jgi:hypothetical protein